LSQTDKDNHREKETFHMISLCKKTGGNAPPVRSPSNQFRRALLIVVVTARRRGYQGTRRYPGIRERGLGIAVAVGMPVIVTALMLRGCFLRRMSHESLLLEKFRIPKPYRQTKRIRDRSEGPRC
jgi:hypothetical protein